MHNSYRIKCVWPCAHAQPYQIQWEAKYLALQGFLRENGGRYPSRLAKQSTDLERSLGYWVARQRSEWRLRHDGGAGGAAKATARLAVSGQGTRGCHGHRA